jgi:hypothetical protein
VIKGFFFASTKLPQQEGQRMPTMLRFTMILSISSSPIVTPKLAPFQNFMKKMGRTDLQRDDLILSWEMERGKGKRKRRKGKGEKEKRTRRHVKLSKNEETIFLFTFSFFPSKRTLSSMRRPSSSAGNFSQ